MLKFTMANNESCLIEISNAIRGKEWFQEGMQKHKRGANSKNIDANRSYQRDFNEDNLKNTEIFRNDKNCIETSNKSDESALKLNLKLLIWGRLKKKRLLKFLQ